MENQEDISSKLTGEWAWLALALGIVSYDVYAVKTKNVETLSTALWKSLAHPVKLPVSAATWFCLTWHLFLNPRARESYRKHFLKEGQ